MKEDVKSRILNKKYLILLIAITATILIVAGFLFYSYQENIIKKEKHSEIKAIADMKTDQILQWFKERKGDGKTLANFPFFNKVVNLYINDKNNTFLINEIRKRLKLYRDNFNYIEVFICTTDGEFLIAGRDIQIKIDTLLKTKIIETSKSNEVVFSDFYYSPHYKSIFLDVLIPLRDSNNLTKGIIVFRIDPNDYLYPLLQSWPTASNTSGIAIVRKEKDSVLFLNNLLHGDNTVLNFRIPLSNTNIPAVRAALGHKGVFEGYDYRGVKVLSDVRQIPNTPWFMVSKIDQDEIYSELNTLSFIIIVIIIILLFMFTIGFLWIYHYKQRNLYLQLYKNGKELFQIQEQFKITLYSIGDAVITTDKSGKIKLMNQVAEELTGWKESEAINKPLTEIFKIINEDTRKTVENPVEKVLREGTVVGLANHTILVSKDGKEIPIDDSGAPIKNESGDIVGVVLVFHDQTEERDAKNKLIESEEKFRQMTEGIKEVFWLGSLDWNEIYYISPAYNQIWGKNPSDLYKNPLTWFDSVIDEDKEKVKNLIPIQISTIESHIQFPDYRIKRPDGSLVWISARAFLLYDAQGLPYRIAGIAEDITERKLAEEKIREKDLQFQKLSANVPDLIFQFTRRPDGSYCVPIASQGIINIFGCNPEDVVEDFAPIANVLHPDDTERVIEDIEYSAKHLTYFTCEFRVLIPGKPVQWIFSRSTPEKLPDGSITWYGFNVNITERKSFEEKLQVKNIELERQYEEYMQLNEVLRQTNYDLEIAKEIAEESEEKYRLILENAGVGIGYYSPEGIVISFNSLAAKYMNGVPEDFTGRSIYDIFTKQEAEFYFGRIVKAVKSNEIEVYEDFVELPNEKRWFLSAFTKITNSKGETLGIQIISQDISAIKNSEIELIAAKEKIQESEEKYRALYVNAPLSYQSLDENGCFLDVNPMWLKTLGYERDEIIGSWFGDYLHPDYVEHFKINFPAFKKRGYVSDVQFKMRKKDGTFIYVSFEGCIGYTPDGKFRQTYCVFKDITESKLAEEEIIKKNKEIERQYEEYMQLNEDLTQTNKELIKAKIKAEESDKLKTAFLQNLSHEIRTPLNGILGFSELLCNDSNTKEDIHQYSKIIIQSGTRLLNTVNDVLEIAKIETGQITMNYSKFSVDSLIKDLYNFFHPSANLKNLKLSYQNPAKSEDIIILSDEQKIHQILVNLINNAIKFTESGIVDFGYEIYGNKVQFFVKDTGLGIPPDKFERIFERFTQVDDSVSRGYEGTGLGLAICKGLVELLKGQIWVESLQNGGSTFYFTIPYQPVEIFKEEDQNVSLSSDFETKKTILIADDDIVSFKFLVTLLRSKNTNLIRAENGVQTLDIIKNNPDINLVLMDIRMPEMNGIEATKQIKQIRPDIPIIAVTAYAFEEEKNEILKAGCNDYISKPIDIKKFLVMVRKHLS